MNDRCARAPRCVLILENLSINASPEVRSDSRFGVTKVKADVLCKQNRENCVRTGGPLSLLMVNMQERQALTLRGFPFGERTPGAVSLGEASLLAELPTSCISMACCGILITP